MHKHIHVHMHIQTASHEVTPGKEPNSCHNLTTQKYCSKWFIISTWKTQRAKTTSLADHKQTTKSQEITYHN